jgi:microcystin-dependent protein
MASVTGMTAEAINEELDKMIVSITVDPETGIMYANPRSGDPISAGPALSLDGVADVVWPVGSIYMSTTPTNPATTLGVGTWSRWGQGRVPVSQSNGDPEFDAVEETGGVKTVTLTSAQSGLRAHSHTFTGTTGSAGLSPQFNEESSATNGATSAIVRRGVGGGTPPGLNRSMLGSDHAHSFGGTTSSVDAADASSAHTNLQPYIVCYMWKRTG